MCDERSSVSLSQDDGGAVDSVGLIAAHELGHIFNMAHDNSPSKICLTTSITIVSWLFNL